MTTDCRVAEIQLKYKPQPLTETISSARDIYKLLVNRVYDEETIGYRETFKVLLLNNANKIIGYTTISDGGLTSTIVDVRVIIQTALVCNATSIIITHNHPSGNPHPSGQDDSHYSRKAAFRGRKRGTYGKDSIDFPGCERPVIQGGGF